MRKKKSEKNKKVPCQEPPNPATSNTDALCEDEDGNETGMMMTKTHTSNMHVAMLTGVQERRRTR